MKPKTKLIDEVPLKLATAQRLRVIMAELDLKTAHDLGDLVGASRSQVSNWLQGYHLPPVEHMLELKRRTGIPLDFVFDDDPTGLSYEASIRLRARELGLEPPETEPEPPDGRAVSPPLASVSRPKTRSAAVARVEVEAPMPQRRKRSLCRNPA